jgi:hypothetical protein
MTDPLLECVIAGSDEAAADAWSRWRSATDIDSIPWRDTLLVPMIAESRRIRFQAGDPAAPILSGFVRRAWTQGAILAARARGVVGALRHAGLGPVMIGGSTASFLLCRTDGALRPVTDTTILLPRDQLEGAVAVLGRERWVPRSGIPSRAWRGWASAMIVDRGRESLRVAWRHLAVPPWRSAGVERMLFAQRAESLPPEALLLSRLSREGDWDGMIPLEADVAHLSTAPIDWDGVFGVARELAPTLDARLRRLGGAVPGVPRPSAAPRLAVRLEDVVSRAIHGMTWRLRRIGRTR